MHPLIPQFGPFTFHIPIPGLDAIPIHGFGVLVAIGFLFGAHMASRKCVRDGLDPEFPNKILGWVVLGVFVGGHLGHVLFYEPAYYLEHPLEVFKVWSGLSSFGGFIACGIIVAIFMKKTKVPFWPSADVILFGLVYGWIFGRLGCFSAHDHPGTPTMFWLGVQGICPNGDKFTACHDLGFYEAMFTMCLGAFNLWADRKPRFPGFFVVTVFVTYGVFRFFLDFLRADDVRYLGLTPAQYGSIGIIVLGGIFWSRTHKLVPWRLRPKEPAAPALPDKDGGEPGSRVDVRA